MNYHGMGDGMPSPTGGGVGLRSRRYSRIGLPIALLTASVFELT